jgi:DNA repair exonuclease SbcCD ATPase subunit
VEFERGALCLAGANGIGKSTFLSTLNYGLTGAVPHPQRPFLSTGKYLWEARAFASEYFEGRISETDRDTAAITIDFLLGTDRYTVSRGLFDSSDVRSFTINDQPQGASPETSDLDSEYRRCMTRDIGLASFEQFVFMQHFIFTFDEGRHLLFWDEQATAQTMYLCFGGSPEEAAKADHLNREMERAASRGRNFQFQATNVKKRIDILKQSFGTTQPDPDLDALDDRYKALRKDRDATIDASSKFDGRLLDAEVKVARLSASLSTVRATYNSLFDRAFGSHAHPSSHPIVSAAIDEAFCGICQTRDPAVGAAVQSKIGSGICPFCDTPIRDSKQVDPAAMAELALADAQLAKTRAELEDASAQHSRLLKEAQNAQNAVAMAAAAVAAFEDSNPKSINVLRGRELAADGAAQQSLAAMEEAYRQVLVEREREYSERDKHRDELKLLQRELEVRYAVAEETFLPLFRHLAKLFLGIDLDIKLKTGAGTGMKLALSMRGDTRDAQYQLSESQRFFIDIALRMALSQLISSEGGAAQLFIDTPEGSLDIAYEDRAGEMFSDFVKSGHDLVMTANINTSALLTTLARHCGPAYMTLSRMTGWTELSDVQASASAMFESAFEGIELALQQGAGQSPHA